MHTPKSPRIAVLVTLLFATTALASAAACRSSGAPGSASARSRGHAPAPAARPKATDTSEKRILKVLEEMDSERSGMMNVSKADGKLLRMLVAMVNAKHVVEIGTSNGYSSIWMALAVRRTGGRITTFEIDEGRAKLARRNWKRAGVTPLMTLVMGDAHEKVKSLQGPIDVPFLDADKSGYVDYLAKLLPKIRPGGLILAHNMVYPKPDPRFIKAITTNPALETHFLLMNGAGMGVTLKKRPVPPK